MSESKGETKERRNEKREQDLVWPVLKTEKRQSTHNMCEGDLEKRRE